MMVNPYNDSHLLLALQIDHSRVAGFLASHWGNKTSSLFRLDSCPSGAMPERNIF